MEKNNAIAKTSVVNHIFYRNKLLILK